jgi:hypothetical protein
MVCLPGPYFNSEYFLASLHAPSFASAPELARNTFFIPAGAHASTNFSAKAVLISLK